MRRAANRLLSRAIWLGLAALPAAAQDAPPDYVEIAIQGELTTEMRAALADVLEPETDHRTLIAAFQNAVPTGIVLDADQIDATGAPIWSQPTFNLQSVVTATAAGFGDSSQLQHLPPEIRPDIDATVDTAFIFTDAASDLARAYGGRDFASQIGAATSVAVPIDRSKISAITGFGASVATAPDFRGELAFNATAIKELARIEQDVEQFGSSLRTIAIAPTATEAQRARFFAAFKAAEGASAEPTSQPSAVEIDVPDGAVLQSAANGRCTETEEEWPFDADKVARLLAHNLRVLDQFGLRHPPRARILVVDSGLPPGLARLDRFARHLMSNPALTLRPGYFVPNTSGQRVCRDAAVLKGESSLGYVAVALGSDECVALKENGYLTPPLAVPGNTQYIPDHGGLVGVVAMGGPAMLGRVSGLDDLIGIGFARIAREDGQRVAIDPPDIGRAFLHAHERAFTVVNASLRATERAKAEIAPTVGRFGEVGLVVAAAGNSGGELLPGSNAFPASIASFTGDNDTLIVVGGVFRPNSISPELTAWPDSSFSATLVDIAAPAADVPSLDGTGRLSCFSGTSVAAPQVSFVAALLGSFGYQGPAEIKRRILATATIRPDLAGRVRGGRLLDVGAALDVFADLVWVDGKSSPDRVTLLPPEPSGTAAMLRLCEPAGSSLAASNGWIDASRLVYWTADRPGQATIWHETGGTPALTRLDTACRIPAEARVRMRFKEGREETVELSRIDRIVPSRLRLALTVSMVADFPPP